MRYSDDVAAAKLAVVRQLGRKDIGQSHQRAFLHGLLAALEWCEGASTGNAKALQRLADGEEVAADNGSHIGGAPFRKPVGRAGRPDLVRRYQMETGDVGLAGYQAWLEGQVAGVGLIVV